MTAKRRGAPSHAEFTKQQAEEFKNDPQKLFKYRRDKLYAMMVMLDGFMEDESLDPDKRMRAEKELREIFQAIETVKDELEVLCPHCCERFELGATKE